MAINFQELIPQAFVLGIGATAALDLWALGLRGAFGLDGTDWGLVGRWFAHMPRGRLRHDAISKAEAVPRERMIGWSAHYVVGIAYAAIYLVLCGSLDQPVTFTSATAFGAVTVLAPWLILQPGLGLGRFAARTTNPSKVRCFNVVNHTLFGSSLYVVWWVVI